MVKQQFFAHANEVDSGKIANLKKNGMQALTNYVMSISVRYVGGEFACWCVACVCMLVCYMCLHAGLLHVFACLSC